MGNVRRTFLCGGLFVLTRFGKQLLNADKQYEYRKNFFQPWRTYISCGKGSCRGENRSRQYGRENYFPADKTVFAVYYYRKQGYGNKVDKVYALCGKLVEAAENRQVDNEYHSSAHAEGGEYSREKRRDKRPYHASSSLPPEMMSITPNTFFNADVGIFFISTPPSTAPASPKGIRGRASPQRKLLS